VNPYEVMFIVNPNLDGEAVDVQIERFGRLVAERGGQVLSVDKWGKRRFAYEIKGLTEGYYVVMQFRADRTAVDELSRVMRIADEVVRHMVVRLDESQLKAARPNQPAAEAGRGSASPGEAADGEAGGADGQADGGAAANVEASTTASSVE